MTDTVDPYSDESDRVFAEQMRARIKEIETARRTQPERLATARAVADEARGWSLIEEPFEVTTVTSVDSTASLALPSVTARELWGARLCFDLLDCGDDSEQINEVLARLFTTTGGDTGVTMLIMSVALSAAAALVEQLLNEIEQHGGDWDARVRLAQARNKAWRDRIAENRNSAATKPVEEGEPW